jgi:hypothetical protein
MSKLLLARFLPPTKLSALGILRSSARGALATRSLFSVLFDPALGLYVLVVISLIALWLPASSQPPDRLRMISAEIPGPCGVLGALALLVAPMIASKIEYHWMTRWAWFCLLAASRPGALVFILYRPSHSLEGAS